MYHHSFTSQTAPASWVTFLQLHQFLFHLQLQHIIGTVHLHAGISSTLINFTFLLTQTTAPQLLPITETQNSLVLTGHFAHYLARTIVGSG